MNCSVSEENYLKAIYHLQEAEGKVTTTLLAGRLQTRPASVTDMMKKLNAKNLVHYTPYQGFTLNNEGRRVALSVIRRHRLWEYFLAEKLDFSWDEVHSVAEDLEHVSSAQLIDRLDKFLGYPRFDPHGDPIPDDKGKMGGRGRVSLDRLEEGQAAELCQVSNPSGELLDYLRSRNITLGTRLELRKRHGFDGSLELRNGRRTVTISGELAKQLFVEKL